MNQVKKQRPIDTLFDVLLKHPYILVALFCLMLLPFGFSQAGHVTTEGIIIEAMIWCLAISAFIAFGKPSSNPKVNVFSIQTAGYNNIVVPEYGYRTNILFGWTGKELVFADSMIKFWNGKEN